MSSLSGHGHSHSHGRGSYRDYSTAMKIFAIVGPIEIAIGLLVGNPLVTSIGGHDTADIMFPLVGSVVAWISARADVRWRLQTGRRGWQHSLACQLPVYTGLAMGVANILLVGVLPLVTTPRSLNVGQAMWGVGMAIVSSIANGYSARSMRGVTADQAKATRAHFLLDMWSAVATIVGSVLTVWLGSIWWAIGAIIVILVVSLTQTVPNLWSGMRRLHRMVRHPEGHDHTHH